MGSDHELRPPARSLGPWLALAGLGIGAGLYFGLQGVRDRPAPPAPVAALDAPRVDPAAVEHVVRAALEPLRLQWRAACWDPASTGVSIHPIELAFDETGREIARAINEDRARTSPAIAQCLRTQPHVPIAIAAPGAPTVVRFEIRLP